MLWLSDVLNSLIDQLESLRIDVETESFGDTTGNLQKMYMRANEMLDDCVKVVSDFTSEDMI